MPKKKINKSQFQKAAGYLSKKLQIKEKSAKQKITRAAKKDKPIKLEGSKYGRGLFNKAVKEKRSAIAAKKADEEKKENRVDQIIDEIIDDYLSPVENAENYIPGRNAQISVTGEFYISNHIESREINFYVSPDEADEIMNAKDFESALDAWFNSDENNFIGQIKSASEIKYKGSWK